ncbi:hypothetical protein ABPG72_015441 [Tetrahymena utriculariae]
MENICPECGNNEFEFDNDRRFCNDCGFLYENFMISMEEHIKNETTVRTVETNKNLIENYVIANYARHKEYKRLMELTINYHTNFKNQSGKNYVDMINKTVQYVDGCPNLDKNSVVFKKLLSLDKNVIFSVGDVSKEKIIELCQKVLEKFGKEQEEKQKEKMIEIIIHDFVNYNKLVKSIANSPIAILSSLIHFVWCNRLGMKIKTQELSKFLETPNGGITNIKTKFLKLEEMGIYQFGQFMKLE